MKLSTRVSRIAPSGSIEIAAQIKELRSQGEKIIGLNVGEPDFPAHQKIIESTVKALKGGHTNYSLVSGEVELRDSIANYYSQKFSRKVDRKNVLVGNGSKQIIY